MMVPTVGIAAAGSCYVVPGWAAVTVAALLAAPRLFLSLRSVRFPSEK